MEKIDGESTDKEKYAFERVLKLRSATVQYYHSKHELFNTNIFKDAASTAGKTRFFCGVNSRHQNIKIENRIKYDITGARPSLLNAAHQCPEAIYSALCPAALKTYTNLINYLPTEFKPVERIENMQLPDTYNSSPMSKFTITKM